MNRKKEIKKVIEQILGSGITMREDYNGEEEKLKDEFASVIKKFQDIWERQIHLLEKENIDFTSYDDPYFKVIEGLINFCFDDGASDAILFYVYSRKDQDGEVLPYIDKVGKEHYFKNVDDLWEFLLYWAEEIMKL